MTQGYQKVTGDITRNRGYQKGKQWSHKLRQEVSQGETRVKKGDRGYQNVRQGVPKGETGSHKLRQEVTQGETGYHKVR